MTAPTPEQTKRVLLTHPHDGHSDEDTCLGCIDKEKKR